MLGRVKDQFLKSGYKEIDGSPLKEKLLWLPDLFLTKDNYTYLVLVKSNNSVPPTYLNRIADRSKQNLIPLIIFAQKLSATNESAILSLGISIGYFLRGKLVHLNIQRKLSVAEVKKEIKRKLEVIDIFISSKQQIHERVFVEDRIETLRKTNYYPFNPPHLIEHDKFNTIDLYPYIDEVMDICEWIVIILEDSYSDVVSYEITRAIETIAHDNIFMFVKGTNACQTAWGKELNKIKALDSQSIKYIPYLSLNDLEVYLTRAIKKRMVQICKQYGVKLFE